MRLFQFLVAAAKLQCGSPETGVFVLGVSRGGTSAIMSVLDSLGLSLGDVPDGGKAHPEGINELPEVVRTDSKIYKAMNLKWKALPKAMEEADTSPKMVAAAKRVLESFIDSQHCKSWALKDPRMVVTLPVWAKAAKELGAPFVVLFIAREPVSNAKSLYKHGRFEDPLQRWEEYNLLALEHLRQHPHVSIHYGELVSAEVRHEALQGLLANLQGAGVVASMPDGGTKEIEKLIFTKHEPIAEAGTLLPCGRKHTERCELTASQVALATAMRTTESLESYLRGDGNLRGTGR